MSKYTAKGRGVHRWSPQEIRLLRMHCGMSQQEFADLLEVQAVTISRWETGRRVPRRMLGLLFNDIARRAGYFTEQGI